MVLGESIMKRDIMYNLLSAGTIIAIIINIFFAVLGIHVDLMRLDEM